VNAPISIEIAFSSHSSDANSDGEHPMTGSVGPASPGSSISVVARFALWNLGFRPFYLVAGVFSVVSILLWITQYAGYLRHPYLDGPLWHAHEMLFGYALAVVAGFLLTAVRTWTGLPTASETHLKVLVLLWIAGRVSVLTPYGLLAAVVGVAFPIAVAVAIASPLIKSRNRRNYFFVVVLMLLSVAELAFHLSYMGRLAWPAQASVLTALDVVLFLIAVLSGRVVPMFTNNGVPDASARRNNRVEQLALALILTLVVADAAQAPSRVIAVLCLSNALAHGVRLTLWHPWKTLRTPLVWILHAAYGWIVIYFLLRACAAAGLVAHPLAIHALTIGAIGSMTLGMMTRTARGHTGRPLMTNQMDLASFALIQIAALIRVFGGMLLPMAYVPTVILAGILWSLAFAIFVFGYWSVLIRVRTDGKPG
jgi:uncharacterized protein involved in response to NO